MKTGLLSFLLILSTGVFSQATDTGSWAIGESWANIYASHLTKVEFEIEYSENDSVTSVTGDTIKAIESLLKQVHQLSKTQDSIEHQYTKFMAITVEYTNCLPDIWKDRQTNQLWAQYNRFIHENGYSEIKKSGTNCVCPQPVNPRLNKK